MCFDKVEFGLFEQSLRIQVMGTCDKLSELAGLWVVWRIGENQVGFSDCGACLGAVTICDFCQIADENGEFCSCVPVSGVIFDDGLVNGNSLFQSVFLLEEFSESEAVFLGDMGCWRFSDDDFVDLDGCGDVFQSQERGFALDEFFGKCSKFCHDLIIRGIEGIVLQEVLVVFQCVVSFIGQEEFIGGLKEICGFSVSSCFETYDSEEDFCGVLVVTCYDLFLCVHVEASDESELFKSGEVVSAE